METTERIGKFILDCDERGYRTDNSVSYEIPSGADGKLLDENRNEILASAIGYSFSIDDIEPNCEVIKHPIQKSIIRTLNMTGNSASPDSGITIKVTKDGIDEYGKPTLYRTRVFTSDGHDISRDVIGIDFAVSVDDIVNEARCIFFVGKVELDFNLDSAKWTEEDTDYVFGTNTSKWKR